MVVTEGSPVQAAGRGLWALYQVLNLTPRPSSCPSLGGTGSQKVIEQQRRTPAESPAGRS